MAVATKIEELCMESIDLCLVDPLILGKAVNNLKHAGLRKTEMFTTQCIAILEQAVRSTSLSHLDLCQGDFEINEDLINSAKKKILDLEIFEDHGEDAWGNHW